MFPSYHDLSTNYHDKYLQRTDPRRYVVYTDRLYSVYCILYNLCSAVRDRCSVVRTHLPLVHRLVGDLLQEQIWQPGHVLPVVLPDGGHAGLELCQRRLHVALDGRRLQVHGEMLFSLSAAHRHRQRDFCLCAFEAAETHNRARQIERYNITYGEEQLKTAREHNIF